jgi:hypothetical protein
MLIGQHPSYINQWMGEVELCWLSKNYVIVRHSRPLVCKSYNDPLLGHSRPFVCKIYYDPLLSQVGDRYNFFANEGSAMTKYYVILWIGGDMHSLYRSIVSYKFNYHTIMITTAPQTIIRHHNIKCVIFLAIFMYCLLSLVNVNRPIHGWHIVANGFSLNESRSWIPQIQHV